MEKNSTAFSESTDDLLVIHDGDGVNVENTTTVLVSLTMSSPDPTSLILSTRTIAGLPVTTFSYIFLAVGGAAPILFIIIVVISMKCYSWRKFRKYQRYAAQLQACKNVWDFERSIQNGHRNNSDSVFNVSDIHDGFTANNHFAAGPSSRDLLQTTELPQVGFYKKGKSDLDLRTINNDPDAIAIASLKLSTSNPNVFFKETPLLVVNNPDRNARSLETINHIVSNQDASKILSNNGFHPLYAAATRTNGLNKTPSSNTSMLSFKTSDRNGKLSRNGKNFKTHQNQTNNNPSLRHDSDSSSQGINNNFKSHSFRNFAERGGSSRSLRSEEARALACFDRIYDELDISAIGNDSVLETGTENINLGQDNPGFVNDESPNPTLTCSCDNSSMCQTQPNENETCPKCVGEQLSLVQTCAYPVTSDSRTVLKSELEERTQSFSVQNSVYGTNATSSTASADSISAISARNNFHLEDHITKKKEILHNLNSIELEHVQVHISNRETENNSVLCPQQDTILSSNSFHTRHDQANSHISRPQVHTEQSFQSFHNGTTPTTIQHDGSEKGSETSTRTAHGNVTQDRAGMKGHHTVMSSRSNGSLNKSHDGVTNSDSPGQPPTSWLHQSYNKNRLNGMNDS